jgi:hypothetical protein
MFWEEGKKEREVHASVEKKPNKEQFRVQICKPPNIEYTLLEMYFSQRSIRARNCTLEELHVLGCSSTDLCKKKFQKILLLSTQKLINPVN